MVNIRLNNHYILTNSGAYFSPYKPNYKDKIVRDKFLTIARYMSAMKKMIKTRYYMARNHTAVYLVYEVECNDYC